MRIISQVSLLFSALGCFGLTDTSKLFGQHPLAYTYDGTAQYDPRSCVCGNDPQHYPNIIADAVLPAHPGTIFNLMYSYHDEIKDFWARQGMHDLRTIGWVPQDPSYSNSRLRTRTMLFSVDIPEGLQLNHNVTRIQVTDTITHLRDCPFSSSVLSTIYAPDVASGHAFAVKTRTCIIPHAKSEARLFVTAVLVWGDGSDFQRPIGQAALVGLRQYHDNILSVMREEISTNKEVYASLDEAAIIETKHDITRYHLFVLITKPPLLSPTPIVMARLSLHLFFTYLQLGFVGANWVYHPEARDYITSDERFNQPYTVLPTNPDGVLDAMYTDREPVMNFWQRDQGFTDLHSTGWFPQDPAYPNSRLRTRSTSFTKDIPDGLPLSHGVVGKRTRIEVIDTITHSEDGPTGTAILSTLRAPNLMNGHAFAVRTRTCLVPEGTSGTRLLVTAMVRWNQRVNYGETIEDFAFDALKKYYQDITNFTRREMISYKGGYESFREEPCCNFGRSDRDASAKHATYREQLPSEREQESSYGSYKPRIAVPIQGAEPSTGCEDLQGQIHQLSQSLRRVEMRVIDNENRIADLEAQLREARRVLKVI
ncbi:hypothetical protein RHS03_07306, partial [Rhizoctonia solani]